MKQCDMKLIESARAIAADRSNPWTLRVKAKILSWAFSLRSKAGRNGPSFLKFRFHGNWCGPGHGGPGDPISKLDCACKEHDLCYEEEQSAADT